MPEITWLRLGISLGALLIAFSGGFELRLLIDHSNERAQLIADAKAKAAAQLTADVAAADWEKKLADLHAANKKLARRLQNETKKAIYSTCTVPSDGVQLYNDAIGQGTSGSDGAMPIP